MLVKDIMKTEVATCPADTTIRSAAKKMINGGVGCLLITENDFVRGIITKSDIVRSLAEKKDVDYCKVSEIMKTNVISCAPDMNIHAGAHILSEKKVKRIPVLRMGKLEGLVSISELAPVLNKEAEEISAYFWR